MSDLPILLALVHSPTIRAAIAEKVNGFDIRWSFEPDGIDKQGELARREITGIADLHPALIVVELDQPADWLPKVHADSATRRIPIIAIVGSIQAIQRAKDAKINVTMTTDAVIDALPDVVIQYARIFKQVSELQTQCDAVPSPEVLEGLHQFNAQEYYECHETLESAWKKETGPVRELYRAILQVGIAYYHIQRRNYWGAQKVFLRTLQWFEPMPDWCQGINVAQLRADAMAARAHLDALGPERVSEFDQSLLKPIRFEGDTHG